MGACASKIRKNKEKYRKDQKKSNSICEQSSSINADKFANVPFIDSEEKVPTTPTLSSSSVPPPAPSSTLIPADDDDNED